MRQTVSAIEPTDTVDETAALRDLLMLLAEQGAICLNSVICAKYRKGIEYLIRKGVPAELDEFCTRAIEKIAAKEADIIRVAGGMARQLEIGSRPHR